MQLLTDANFDATLKDSPLLLVMFTAPWAGPCNMVKPAFDEAAGRLGNSVTFATFGLDDNPNTPEKYGVRQIPLFVMFKDGDPVAMTAGAISAEDIMTICTTAMMPVTQPQKRSKA